MKRVGWCVTTTESPRIREVHDNLASAGLGWVRDYVTQRDHEDGKRGCFRAHVSAISHAFDESACDFVWMFEDDVAFERELHPADLARIEAVAVEHGALVAIGGMAVAPLWLVAPPDVYHGTWNYTHAYVVPRSCADAIKRLKYEGDHYDRVLARHFTQLLVHPALAYQRPSTPSLTSASPVYHAITSFRNYVGPSLIQWVLGVFWVCVAWAARHVHTQHASQARAHSC
jgi:hypothetical protein